ncbi:hypothetical protein ATSB10_01530 [Dyella thiooxydans]|uniref:Uncharacterized protein n=1 Tax=Dyella thiooxydans TaxID=445710 RepID=A0A160MXS5_9GAMM|nr:hypothetical protein [Dyella thiooxydans]AND67607.1 hypothetical protein ATSB10_01530 [Dyella thiooxydans]
MGNYAVFLEGANFRLSEGGNSLSGFFITKRVEAPDIDEAKRIAIQELWLRPELVGQEGSAPTPTIEVRVVEELLVSMKMKDTGLHVFPMDED